MIRNSLRHITEAATKAIETSQGSGGIPATERVYQFKITLKEIRPPIWRRIQTKDCTLDKLHEHIQTAMGWTNSHLHQFEINGVRHGDPELIYEGWEDEEPPVNSRRLKISKIVPADGKRFSSTTNTTSATVGNTKLSSRVAFGPRKAPGIHSALKVNGPARLKMSAG